MTNAEQDEKIAALEASNLALTQRVDDLLAAGTQERVTENPYDDSALAARIADLETLKISGIDDVESINAKLKHFEGMLEAEIAKRQDFPAELRANAAGLDDEYHSEWVAVVLRKYFSNDAPAVKPEVEKDANGNVLTV